LTIDRDRLKQIVEQELKKMRAEVNAAHDEKGRFAKKGKGKTYSLTKNAEDDVADDDSKTTQILKAIFTESITPDGLRVDGTTPEIIAKNINMKEKTLRNRLGILKNDLKLVGYSRPCYYLTKQGAKQLSVDCVSIRAEVEEYIKSEWGRV